MCREGDWLFQNVNLIFQITFKACNVYSKWDNYTFLLLRPSILSLALGWCISITKGPSVHLFSSVLLCMHCNNTFSFYHHHHHHHPYAILGNTVKVPPLPYVFCVFKTFDHSCFSILTGLAFSSC